VLPSRVTSGGSIARRGGLQTARNGYHRSEEKEVEMAEGGRIFQAYSFRTSSRFGGPVDVIVENGLVTVTGRRVPRQWRDAWIGAQGGLMGALFFALVLPLFTGRRRRPVWRLALLEYLVAAFGALLVWWPADRARGGMADKLLRSDDATAEAARASFGSWTFPVSAVTYAERTRWYWRRGLWLIAWPWQLLAMLMPGGTEVVFDVATADEPPREHLVFALAMATAEQADDLVAALRQ
jgi:hypothetical protein